MPQAKERGPEVAHTPATPGLNAPPGVPGPACAFAGANHHAHAASVGHNETPQGVGFWIPVSLATGRRGGGFVDEGRESPASRAAAHTPRSPTPLPQNPATLIAMKSVRASRRSGLREDPAGLNSRPRRTPTPGTTRNPTTPTPVPITPRHHKKPRYRLQSRTTRAGPCLDGHHARTFSSKYELQEIFSFVFIFVPMFPVSSDFGASLSTTPAGPGPREPHGCTAPASP